MKKRRVIPVAIALVAIVALSGVAYAYWSSGGSGSGTAQAGTTLNLTVNQTSSITGLYPGQTPVTLSGTFDNPNAYSVWVAAVTATVDSVTGGDGACANSNFAVDGTAPVGALVPAGDDQGTWTGLTIQLVETGGNQDGCKNATVHLAYVASGT